MDVIWADECVDGWDIYVMDEIYMWYMFVWIYLSWWNVKKIKNYSFGSLCRVLHSAKDPFAQCNGHNTRQSWKNGCQETHFFSFAECCDHCTRQRGPLPSATLGKVTKNGKFYYIFYIPSWQIHSYKHISHIYLIHHIYISSIAYISHPSHIYISSIHTYHIHHNI